MSRKTTYVMGVDAPPPRLTRGAFWLLGLWIALPVIGFLFGIDLLLWSFGIWPYG